MIVRNRITKKVYDCSQVDAAKIIGKSTRTLYKWQYEERLQSKYTGIYEVIFDEVRKITQKRGFALKPFKKEQAS